MSHVFISYSKKNRSYARKLADHLLSLGFDVWIDDRIDYGEMWERTIFKAIDDCAALIVIMTPESYASDWVLREIQYADRRHKSQFPVLLDGEDFPRYGPHQHVDVRGGILPPEDFYERLESAVPRKTKTGANVTPQNAAVPETDTLPRTPVAPSSGQTGRLNNRIIPAIAVAVLALLVIGLVLLNRPSKTEEQVQTLVVETATLRQQFTEYSSTMTSEANQQVAVIPTATEAHSPSPTLAPTRTSTVTPTPLPTATFTVVPTKIPTVQGGGTGQIVFNSDRDRIGQIYVMDVDGNNIQKVTNNQTDHNHPDWSPNGNQIAFDSYLSGNYEIYVVNADGTQLTRLTNNSASDTQPDWSPDGQQIAFISSRDGNSEIYVMNVDGTHLVRLTQNIAVDSYPKWSPDGHQIAFASNRDGKYQIYLMDSDGRNPLNISKNSYDDYAPDWSPDGKEIVFYSRRDNNREIYVMGVDGSNQHNLSNNSKDDLLPVWSPDGQQIAFTSERDLNSEIYVMNADGSNQHNISNNSANDKDPQWRTSAPNPDPLKEVPVVEKPQATITKTP
jgi:Tol biopolymer transport system component